MSSLPDIGEVAGEAAGDDEHGVDANVVVRAGEARRELFGRGGHPAQAVLVEGNAGGVGGGALLDLDEGDNPSAASNEVDLAASDTRPAGEDAPAVKAEPPGSERLGAAAAALGG